MLNVFSLANGRLYQEEIESHEALARVQPIWVDLDAPSDEEKGWIAEHFGLTIPSDAVDDDLEESARFYEEDNGELHIRSDFLIDDGETPRNVRVAFILARNILFSVHAEDLPVFRLLRLRARRIPALIEDAKDVLLKLYDADAEYSADALEGIYDSLEAVSARVLRQDVDDKAAGEALSAIAKDEDLNGRIRRNVMDTRRAVSFMMRSRMLNAEQFEEARQILRDIDSLDIEHPAAHHEAHRAARVHHVPANAAVQVLFFGDRRERLACRLVVDVLAQHARAHCLEAVVDALQRVGRIFGVGVVELQEHVLRVLDQRRDAACAQAQEAKDRQVLGMHREQDVAKEDEGDADVARRLAVIDQKVGADVKLAVVFLVEAGRFLEVVVDGVARDGQAEVLGDPALLFLGRRVEVDPDRLDVGERLVTLDLFLEQPAIGQREDIQHESSGEQDPARQERTVTQGGRCPRTKSRNAVTKLSHRQGARSGGAACIQARS